MQKGGFCEFGRKFKYEEKAPKTQEGHLILPYTEKEGPVNIAYTEKECSILLKVRNMKHWGLLLIPKLIC